VANNYTHFSEKLRVKTDEQDVTLDEGENDPRVRKGLIRCFDGRWYGWGSYVSRRYRMCIEIRGYNPKQAAEIQDAASKEWDWDTNHWREAADKNQQLVLSGDGESSLCGGESEEKFVSRLQRAVWKANQAYCAVHVCCVYLEDPPCECYDSVREEYEKAEAAGLLNVKKGEVLCGE